MSTQTIACPDCDGVGQRDYTPTGCEHLAPFRGECHRCDGRGLILAPGRPLAEMIRGGKQPTGEKTGTKVRW